MATILSNVYIFIRYPLQVTKIVRGCCTRQCRLGEGSSFQMNSLNNALIHHWPFPQKQVQKKPAALKKETAYRLGVKFPSDLELDTKIPLSKSSRHNLLKSKYARTLTTQKVTESCSIIDNFHTPSSLKHRHCGGRALGAVPDRNSEPVTTKATVISKLCSIVMPCAALCIARAQWHPAIVL